MSELAIALDRSTPEALHRQIARSIRRQIHAGGMLPGAAVPPSRALAAALGVSRGVVVEAYAQLIAEGYLESRRGSYTTVTAAAARPPLDGAGTAPLAAPAVANPELDPDAAAQPGTPARPDIDFGAGHCDVTAFPRAAWLRSFRRVMVETPDARLGYLDGHGAVELRRALASYLNRVRGTKVVPEQVVITNGYAQAVALLLRVLADRGARTVAVEDPSSNDDARPIAASLGLEVVGVGVGEEGVSLDALDRVTADALILTPSHQWPVGGVLSAEARAAILGWARRSGALIVEDDYDAEFRYDRAPVGAMQGLDPDRVAYSGTLSKTLAPALRLGWLVPPPHLVEPVVAAKLLADRGSPTLEQLTFADFLERGEFDRHLRRMRSMYRARRDVLLDALGRHLPRLQPVGVAAGLHLVAWLPDGLDEEAVIAAAADHGVAISGLSRYRLAPSPRGGLIFGYSRLTDDAIVEGVQRLARATAGLG